MAKPKLKIAVLFGGLSAKHDVSVLSAKKSAMRDMLVRAIQAVGYDRVSRASRT